METLRVINSVNRNVGFRTLTEIERALDLIRFDLESIDQTIERVVAAFSVKITGKGSEGKATRPSKKPSGIELLDGPTAKVIEQNTKLSASLIEKLNVLDGILASLDYQFKNERGHAAVVKETKALRKKVETSMKSAYKAINDVAKGKVSKSFMDFCKAIQDKLLADLDGLYDSSNTRLFVDTLDGSLRFTYYIRFVNLEDESGKTISDYNIIVTNLVGERHDTRFINNAIRFSVPGRVAKGVPVDTVEEALRITSTILRGEGFRDIIKGIPVPLLDSDVDMEKFKDLASKVEINEDSIVFTFKRGVDKAAAFPKLFMLVRGLLQSKMHTKAQIKYRQSGEKISFYLASEKPIPPLPRTLLKQMQEQLNLTDDQVIRLQQQL